MSAIVVLKEKNVLVLGTDSRFMKHDFSAVDSDAEQKIHEIAPGTFIATSGFKPACEFQETQCRILAREKCTKDIRVIGEALGRDSIVILESLAKRLREMRHLNVKIEQTLSGEHLIHGCVLVGRTDRGQLGYVTHAYRLVDGRAVCETAEYFDSARRIWFSADRMTLPFMQDTRCWTWRPQNVVRMILKELKRNSK